MAKQISLPFSSILQIFADVFHTQLASDEKLSVLESMISPLSDDERRRVAILRINVFRIERATIATYFLFQKYHMSYFNLNEFDVYFSVLLPLMGFCLLDNWNCRMDKFGTQNTEQGMQRKKRN